MKKRKVKYHIIIALCCFSATLTACSPHSFRSKKHQRKHFLGEKKKQEAYLSFNSNDSIRVNVFEFRNNDASINYHDVIIKK